MNGTFFDVTNLDENPIRNMIWCRNLMHPHATCLVGVRATHPTSQGYHCDWTYPQSQHPTHRCNKITSDIAKDKLLQKWVSQQKLAVVQQGRQSRSATFGVQYLGSWKKKTKRSILDLIKLTAPSKYNKPHLTGYSNPFSNGWLPGFFSYHP